MLLLYDHTSNSAMVDPHIIHDPFFAPLATPARLNAGAGLARLPSVRTDGSPPIRIVPAQPSGAAALSTPQHDLQDALVGAGCWSIPGRELVPSTMSRPSYPADLADHQVPHARDPEQDEDDADITTAEIARFIAELTETRGLNKWQQDRIEDLTRELEAVRVDTGYTCHDCAALCNDWRQLPVSKHSTMLPHFSKQNQRTQPGLELHHLQSRCQQLVKALDARFQLVAAQRAVAAHPDPELTGKGGSPLVNLPNFSTFSSTRRPSGLLLRGALAPCWHNHTVLHGTTRTFLEPSRNMEESSSSLSRRNSTRDAPFSFFEGSWESAAAGGAVSPHPHKSCLMPRPLSCNAGNRVSTPRSTAGQATRDAVRIPRRQ